MGWAVSQNFAVFGLLPPPCGRKCRNVLLLLAAYIRQRVWQFCCSFVFYGSIISSTSVLSLVKADVRLHIQADFSRCSEACFLRKYLHFFRKDNKPHLLFLRSVSLNFCVASFVEGFKLCLIKCFSAL